MNEQSGRIRFLDFLRGFAVVLMVMGHSIDAVLTLDVRMTPAFRFYDAVRGFTAPLFLFVSGYVFSITTEKRWTAYLRWSAPLSRRLGKILGLFAIGYALHLPFFSLSKLLHLSDTTAIEQFFQVDVLQCVATSLLIMHAIILVARTPHRAACLSLGIVAAIVLSCPWVWSVDWTPFVSRLVSPYLNQHRLSLFPLFPYAGFLLAGAGAGHFFLSAKESGREDVYFRQMLASGVLAAACGLVLPLAPFSIYPPHDFWRASPDFFLFRIGIVTIVTVIFFFTGKLPSLVSGQVITLGKASLLAYVAHLLVVYGSVLNRGLTQTVGQTLAYHQAFLVGVSVLAAMLLLVHLWNYLQTSHGVPARILQFGAALTLLLQFFINP